MTTTIDPNLICDEKRNFFGFAYDVYVGDLGFNFPEADHEHRLLYDDFDLDAKYFFAIRAESTVGICRLNRVSQKQIKFEKLDERYGAGEFLKISENVFYVSRLLIKENFRNTYSFIKILKQIYDNVRVHEDFILLIDCSQDLVAMYTKLGFQLHASEFKDSVLGMKQPMFFSMIDRDYLKEIRSPVLNW